MSAQETKIIMIYQMNEAVKAVRSHLGVPLSVLVTIKKIVKQAIFKIILSPLGRNVKLSY